MQADKYGVTMISEATDRMSLTFRVRFKEKEIYSWKGHTSTVFRILRDRLYYADYGTSSSGGSVVAVDLNTGKVLWNSRLLGIGPVQHSAYSNEIILDANLESVSIWGNESMGRYLEFKDAETGKTVGRKVFERP